MEIAERWSRKQQIFIIDDTAYRELRYSGDDTPSLLAYDPHGHTVILTQTFSKSYSPGVRVGFGVLPATLVPAFVEHKGNFDFGSPNLSQHLLAAVLEAGALEPHILKLREAYRLKMNAMLDAATEHLGELPGVTWRKPQGGLYVWLTLPPGLDAGLSGALFEAALAEHLLYVPGEYCFPSVGAVPPQPHTMRLSFGVQSTARIHLGMAALGRAVRHAWDHQR